MKSLFLTAFYAAFTMGGYAQTSDDEAKAIINLLGIQKKEAIARLVPVSEKDSAAFWKLYEEYQQKNAPVAKNRLQLYETTAMSYSNMSNGMADSLAKKYFENRIAQEKSLEEY
jgi:hypothetical protein